MLGGAVLLSTVTGQHIRWDCIGRVISSSQRTMTTHNTRQKQTSLPPAGFESTIPASKRLRTHALEPAASGIGAVSCSSTACFTLPLSTERFNYSTSILCVPQNFSSINWSDPEHEQSICCQAILLLPIFLVIFLILHLKGIGIKLIGIV